MISSFNLHGRAILILLLAVPLHVTVASSSWIGEELPNWHRGDWWTLKVLTKGPAGKWCEPSFLHYRMVDTTTVQRGTVFRHCYRIEEFLLEDPATTDPLPPGSWVYFFDTSERRIVGAGDGVGPKGYPCRNQADHFDEGSRQRVSGPHMMVLPNFSIAMDPVSASTGWCRGIRLKPAHGPPYVYEVEDLSLDAFSASRADPGVISCLPKEGYQHIAMIRGYSREPAGDFYWHADIPWAVYSEFYNRDRPDEVVQQVWLVDWHARGSDCE